MPVTGSPILVARSILPIIEMAHPPIGYFPLEESILLVGAPSSSGKPICGFRKSRTCDGLLQDHSRVIRG